MSLVHKGHWALWAVNCREGVNIGYPRAEPYYSPPRLGDTVVPKTVLIEDDYLIADLIGESVQDCDSTHKMSLVEFYGAYPGAPHAMGARIAAMKRKLNRSRGQCYEVMKQAKSYVEGCVDTRLKYQDKRD